MPDAAYGNAATVAYGWQHCMTIPRVLTRDNAGHILQNPVSELAARRQGRCDRHRRCRAGRGCLLRPGCRPGGDFSLGFDGGLMLAYSDADRTCYLTFTDAAMSGGRTSRCVVLDAPCRRLRVVGMRPRWKFSSTTARPFCPPGTTRRGLRSHCGPPTLPPQSTR